MNYFHFDVFNFWELYVIIIYFNGRIYDSVLNRFLNPDAYIKEPYNIQNLNRYIQVVSTLKNGDTTNLKVTVKVKVFQDNTKIGEVSETETIEAQKSAISNIYFKLVS